MIQQKGIGSARLVVTGDQAISSSGLTFSMSMSFTEEVAREDLWAGAVVLFPSWDDWNEAESVRGLPLESTSVRLEEEGRQTWCSDAFWTGRAFACMARPSCPWESTPIDCE